MSMLTLSQAATTLKVSEKSIRRYIHSGRLKATQIKGAKGTEYRIDTVELKKLEKPERGRKPNVQQVTVSGQRSGSTSKIGTKKVTKSKTVKSKPVKKNVKPTALSPAKKKISLIHDPILAREEASDDFVQIHDLMAEIEEKRLKFEKQLGSSSQHVENTSQLSANEPVLSLSKDYPLTAHNEQVVGGTPWETPVSNGFPNPNNMDLLTQFAAAHQRIGQLEAQLKQNTIRPPQSANTHQDIVRLEDKIASQEKLIQELYQVIRENGLYW